MFRNLGSFSYQFIVKGVSLFSLTFLFAISYGQVSLSSGDLIQELVITYDLNGNTVKESYTVMRDATNRSQWYFVPREPNLSEVTINGTARPEFTLLRYQFTDGAAPDGVLEGGIAQFSVSLSPPANAIEALRNMLKSVLASTPEGAPGDLALAPLPLKDATASIYSPTDLSLVTSTFGTGLAPIFGSQKAPFALYLTKAGTDISDALIGNSTTSNTGIPLAVVITFQGLTPPASLDITANYKKIFDHYSSDKAFAAKVSYFGLFGASTQMRWTDIEETLKRDGALIVKKIGNSEIDDKDLESVMQTVMQRINDEIIATYAPPAAIAPASADMPSFSDRFGGVGYSVSFKHAHQTAELDDHFTWTEQKIVERKTLVGGFIGLSKYPESVRKQAVVFAPRFNWQTAHFILPDIGAIPKLSQITIKADLVNGNSVSETHTGVWHQATGWQLARGNRQINALDFSLASLLANGVLAKDLKFHITKSVIQDNREIDLESTQDLVNGGIPVSPPAQDLSLIQFNPIALRFNSIDPTSNLLLIQVVMQVGDQSYADIIQPVLDGGNLKRPSSLAWIVKNSDIKSSPIKVNITYNYVAGNTLSRVVNMNDLLAENNKGLTYILRDPATIKP